MPDRAPRYRLPAAWLYYPLDVLFRLVFALFLGVRIRSDPAISKIQGPLLILGNHSSYLDPFYMAVALFPRRIHFLTSRSFFRHRVTRALLNLLQAIPKIQFRTDTLALKRMLQVIRAGGSLAVFPEGQRSIDGSNQPLDASIAKLIKKVACPVVAVRIEGGYLTWPRWSQSAMRLGRVDIAARLLLEPGQLLEMDIPAIQATIKAALHFQDYDWQKLHPHAFLSLAPARGLQNLCHQCPSCGCDLAMQASRFELTCRFCSLRVHLDRFGQFQVKESNHVPDEALRTIQDPYQWHQWQLREMDARVKRQDYQICLPALAQRLSDDGTVQLVGHGSICLSAEGLNFQLDTPLLDGHPGFELMFPIRNISGLNADYGWRFELVSADQAYRFILDQGQAVILLADALTAFKDRLDKAGYGVG